VTAALNVTLLDVTVMVSPLFEPKTTRCGVEAMPLVTTESM